MAGKRHLVVDYDIKTQRTNCKGCRYTDKYILTWIFEKDQRLISAFCFT